MFLAFSNNFSLVMKHFKNIMYIDDMVVYVSGKVKKDVEGLLDDSQ